MAMIYGMPTTSSTRQGQFETNNISQRRLQYVSRFHERTAHNVTRKRER